MMLAYVQVQSAYSRCRCGCGRGCVGSVERKSHKWAAADEREGKRGEELGGFMSHQMWSNFHRPKNQIEPI